MLKKKGRESKRKREFKGSSKDTTILGKKKQLRFESKFPGTGTSYNGKGPITPEDKRFYMFIDRIKWR